MDFGESQTSSFRNIRNGYKEKKPLHTTQSSSQERQQIDESQVNKEKGKLAIYTNYIHNGQRKHNDTTTQCSTLEYKEVQLDEYILGN